MKKLMFIVLVIQIILVPYASASSNFLYTQEKSNYSYGQGNITFPAIYESTKEKGFSRNILVGDINGDGKNEIVAISTIDKGIKSFLSELDIESDNTLFVYDSNLSLLWKFKDISAEKQEDVSKMKTSSLALGDLDGDGVDDIVFSISPTITPIETNNGIPYLPETVLYAFKGDGTQLWNVTLEGGITAESLIVTDIDGDGINDILVGSANLYIISNTGKIKSMYSLENYGYRGVSEIMVNNTDVVFSFWHSNGSGPFYSNYFNIYNSKFAIIKLRFSSGNLTKIWENILKSDESLMDTGYYRMFSYDGLEQILIIQTNPSAIASIDGSTGDILWKYLCKEIGVDYGVAISEKEITFLSGEYICTLNFQGKLINKILIDSHTLGLRGSICIFDVNGDGKEEFVSLYWEGLVYFSSDNETKQKTYRLWEKPNNGYLFPTPVILHADTDNDGFDEIITTDPEGRIVIIDNGSPSSENQNNGFYYQELVMGGAVIFISSIAIIWTWRKRKS